MKEKHNKPINNTETVVEERNHILVIVAFLGPGIRRLTNALKKNLIIALEESTTDE